MADDEVRFHVKPLRRPWRRWMALLAASLLAFTAGVAGGFDYDASRAPTLAAVLALATAVASLATAYGILTWIIGRTPPIATLDRKGVSVRVRRSRDFDLIVPWARVTGARLEKSYSLSTYLCLDVNDPAALLSGFDAAARPRAAASRPRGSVGTPAGASSGIGSTASAAVGSDLARRRLEDRTARFGTPLVVDLRRYWRHRSLDDLDTALQRFTYGRVRLER